MPFCRNCGTRLSKFDNDLCPVCGTPNPFDGELMETQDNTQQVDPVLTYKFRNKKTMLILACTCGFTGSFLFYLKEIKIAIIYLIVNLLVGGLLGLILSFTKNVLLSVILPIGLVYLVSICYGLVLKFKPNLKDGNGEFVQ